MGHGKLIDTEHARNGYHGRCEKCGLALVTDLGYMSWENTICEIKEKDLFKPKGRYVPDTLIHNDYGQPCSIDKYNEAIDKIKKDILKYVKRNQKHSITRSFVIGTTSLTSNAYYELIEEGLLVVEDGLLKIKNFKDA